MSRATRLAVWLVTGLGACLSAGAGTPGIAATPGMRAAPERYLVVTVRNPRQAPAGGYHGGDPVPYGPSPAARAAAARIAATYGLREAASWPIALLGVHCIVYAVPAATDPAELVRRLAADPHVESVQPLLTFATRTSSYNDPYARLQSNLDEMSIAQAQQWSRGAGIRIAVIDTGVDLAHPDLRGRSVKPRNFVDDDRAAFEQDRHGTAVAGVIAAVANNRIGIAGIAPDVKLLAYKACWEQSGQSGPAVCNTFTLAQALAAAIKAGANVVNLSLGGPADPLLTRIVARGEQRGIVFVGAASPSGARDGFPGGVPGVVMVDAPGRHAGAAASLTAPGRDVLTLTPGAHYDFVSGSSLAAAQASAVIALLLAVDRHLGAMEIARLLERTSRPVASFSGSYVAINACAALVALRHEGTCLAQGTVDLARETQQESLPTDP